MWCTKMVKKYTEVSCRNPLVIIVQVNSMGSRLQLPTYCRSIYCEFCSCKSRRYLTNLLPNMWFIHANENGIMCCSFHKIKMFSPLLQSWTDRTTLGMASCKCDVPCTRYQYDVTLSSSLLDMYKIQYEVNYHEKSTDLLPRYQNALENSAQVCIAWSHEETTHLVLKYQEVCFAYFTWCPNLANICKYSKMLT